MRYFTQKLAISFSIAFALSFVYISRANAQFTDANGLPISTDGFAGSLQNRFTISTQIPNRWLNVAKLFGIEEGAVDQLLNSAIASLGIPDLTQLTASISQGKQDQSAPSQLAAALENGTDQLSFSIRSDLSRNSEWDASRGTAYGSVLSDQTQARGQQKRDAVGQAVRSNSSLATESQGLDVTQQILQNVSAQLGHQAEVDAALFDEAEQSRIDRAHDLLLQSQIAESMLGRNVSDRRTEKATARSVTQGIAWLNLPGGKTLTAENSSSRNSRQYSEAPSALSSTLER